MFLRTLSRSFKFQRFFNPTLKYFAEQTQKMPVLDAKNIKKTDLKSDSVQIQPWVDIENRLEKLRGELVLSEQDQIEKYVLSVIKGYFRTTYKDGLTVESKLGDHGLDSLDAIEISMILEDELGYVIEAETMPKFTKVKHFVNYVKHMEAYKKEFLGLPQFKAHENSESMDAWFKGGEKLREKLAGFTKKNKKTQKESKTSH